MIRRPLLFFTIGQGAGILVAYYWGRPGLAIFFIAAICAVFLMQRQQAGEKARRASALVMVAYVLGAFCFCTADKALTKQEAALTESRGFSGKVIETEKKIGSTGEPFIQLTVKNDKGRMVIRCYEGSWEELPVPGSIVEVKGNPEAPAVRRNPGCFDYSLYLKSIGVSAVMTAESLEITRASGSLSGRLFLLKEAFAERLEESCGRDTATLIKAIMFGDKGELDTEILETFQRNGTAHILAVSGLHIGIIYGFLCRIWRRKKGWCFFIFTGCFFGCYVIMAGFSPSVVRAVLMVLLHSFATLTGRRYDLDNAAFSVAILVLAFRPFMLFNAGFQMSFLAVLTLTLVLPYIKTIYSGIFLTSLVVQIGLGPYIIYNFNYLSLIAVFINVPVVLLAGIIVPLGLMGLVLQKTLLMGPVAELTDMLCRSLTGLNALTEIPGLTTFQLASPPLWLIALYYLGLLAFATEEGRLAIIRAPAKAVYIVKVSIIIVALSLAFGNVAGAGFNKCDLTFVDVGQGDCICVRSGSDVYLFDGGGKEDFNLGEKTLRPYLLKNGMGHVDGAFVTHLHTDHYKGICELAQLGMIKKLYVYEGNRAREAEILQETGLKSEDIVYLRAGQKVMLGRKSHVEMLWPGQRTDAEYSRMIADEENENDMSMIMRLEIDGVSMLITGDIDEKGEAQLISEYGNSLQSDILKIAHHGSKYSTSEEFLDAVNPEYAVIQVGKNFYGHPTPEVLEKLEERKVPTYRNDRMGAVGFKINRGKVKATRQMICN